MATAYKAPTQRTGSLRILCGGVNLTEVGKTVENWFAQQKLGTVHLQINTVYGPFHQPLGQCLRVVEWGGFFDNLRNSALSTIQPSRENEDLLQLRWPEKVLARALRHLGILFTEEADDRMGQIISR
jgi:hypothetical protein